MKNGIDVFEPKLFGGAVADEIIACINDSIEERGQCSLSLAGGSTPGAIYRLLGQPPRVNEVEWAKVSLFWGDERWVPKTDNQSNYKMVHDTLLNNLPAGGPKIYPVDTTISSPQAGADAYADVLRGAFQVKAGELPVLDVVLLGCGEDGHTASIFPNSDVIHQKGTICHAVKHPTDGGSRITLSPDTICAARTILFIVKGEDKADIVKRVIQGNESVDLLPSKLYKRVPEKVRWLLDSLAAAKLEDRET